ncbi:MAG: hypothetical protein ACE5G0_23170, partial [Rhodothermales bacterium]
MQHTRYRLLRALGLALLTAVLLSLMPQKASAQTGPISLYELAIDKYVILTDGNTGSYHIDVFFDECELSASLAKTDGIRMSECFPIMDGLEDIEVLDDLPDFLTVTGWETSHGTFDPETGIWDVGDLGVEEVASLWIDVIFEATGLYFNEACITNWTFPRYASSTRNAGKNASGEVEICAAVEVLVLGDRGDPDFVSGLGPGQNVNRNPFRFRADLSLTKNVDNATPAVDDEITY